MKHVLFVCMGNIARSPIAERLLRKILKERGLDSTMDARSRGLQGSASLPGPTFRNLSEYEGEYQAALPALAQFGINLDGHVAIPVSVIDVETTDAIVAMDTKVLSLGPKAPTVQFPTYASRMHLFSELAGVREDIADPFGADKQAVYDAMIGHIDRLLREHLDILQGWATLREV